MTRWAAVIVLAASGLAWSSGAGSAHHRVRHWHAGKHAAAVDLSGRKQVGRASFYAAKFNGRKMADGGRFSPVSDAAASKTLPLGTVARVTNLRNGKTVTVQVRDRGPYVGGRVVDLSPKTAGELGIGKRQGIAPVVVAPVAVPQPDGSVQAGAGAPASPSASAALTPIEASDIRRQR